MKNKTLLSAALTAIISSSAIAAEDASTTVIWNGLVGSSLPGSELIITGEGGRDLRVDPARGSLDISDDGSFSTSDRITLEARDYVAEDTDTGTPEAINDINPEASWTVTDVQYMLGGQMVTDGNVVISDMLSGSELATYNGQTVTPSAELVAGSVLIDVKNDAPITSVAVEGTASLSVSLTAGLDVAGGDGGIGGGGDTK